MTKLYNSAGLNPATIKYALTTSSEASEQFYEDVFKQVTTPVDPNKAVSIEVGGEVFDFDTTNGMPTTYELDIETNESFASLFYYIQLALNQNQIPLDKEDDFSEFLTSLFNLKEPCDWREANVYALLDLVNLPKPHPINAIYDFNGDVNEVFSNLSTRVNDDVEMAATIYAYYLDKLPLSNVMICLFESSEDRRGVLSNIAKDLPPLTAKALNDFNDTDMYAAFYLNSKDSCGATYEHVSTGLEPYSIKPLLANSYHPNSIVCIDMETASQLSNVDLAELHEVLNQELVDASLADPLTLDEIMTLDKVAPRENYEQGYVSAKKQDKAVRETVPEKFTRFSGTIQNKVKILANLMKHQENVAFSYTTKAGRYKTYNRPNRRRPNDPNAIGRSRRQFNRPDMYVYLDCSGSVSQEKYRNAIIAIAHVAQKLNVSIYFVSFSSVISVPKLIRTRNKSVNAIVNEIEKLPKVGGGTNYQPVWSMIDKFGQNCVNLIITDFMYNVGDDRFSNKRPSVKNTFYLPFDGNTYQLTEQEHFAKQFCKSMIRCGATDVKSRIFV